MNYCFRFANVINNVRIIDAFNSDNSNVANINPVQDGPIQGCPPMEGGRGQERP